MASVARGIMGESSVGALRLVKDWVGVDLEQAAEGWVELSEAEEQLVAPATEALELRIDKRRTVKLRIIEEEKGSPIYVFWLQGYFEGVRLGRTLVRL